MSRPTVRISVPPSPLPCRSCGRVMAWRSRGLCGMCYSRARRAGTRADWPMVRHSWPSDTPARIREALSDGRTVAQIARGLRCSVSAVRGIMARHAIAAQPIRRATIAVRTIAEVARLLGCSWGTVRFLIAQGLLRTQQPRRRRGTPTLIADMDLYDCVIAPASWPFLTLDRIADPVWRELIGDHQAAAPGRWWRIAEIAAQTHYSVNWVADWVRSGHWDVPIVRRGQRVWVWGSRGGPPEPPPYRSRGIGRSGPARSTKTGASWIGRC